jgi:thiol-disulfide isomerase/thioredoxin
MSRSAHWIASRRQLGELLVIVGTCLGASAGCNQQDGANPPMNIAADHESPAAQGLQKPTAPLDKPSNAPPGSDDAKPTAIRGFDDAVALHLPAEGAKPTEFVDFLRRANLTRTYGANEEETVQATAAKYAAIVTASDRLLALKPEPEHRFTAVDSKLNALRKLRDLEVSPSAEPNFVAYSAEAAGIASQIAKEATDQELRRRATGLKLYAQFFAATFDTSDADSPAAKALLATIHELTAKPQGKDAADPVTVAQGYHYLVQYRAARVLTGQFADEAQLISAVDSLLAIEQNPEFYQQAKQIAAGLEQAGRRETAVQFVDRIGAAFAKSTDADLVQDAAAWKQTAMRRLSLVGKPFELTGTLSTGEQVDWKALRGKVVVVDFWATWCQPCVQLLPDLKRIHAKYHAQGLELVGVSLDQKRADLDAFLARSPLPWPTLANIALPPGSTDPGQPEANAERCGVEYIPVLVVIDKQGVATAVNLHGEALEAEIERLLKQ